MLATFKKFHWLRRIVIYIAIPVEIQYSPVSTISVNIELPIPVRDKAYFTRVDNYKFMVI